MSCLVEPFSVRFICPHSLNRRNNNKDSSLSPWKINEDLVPPLKKAPHYQNGDRYLSPVTVWPIVWRHIHVYLFVEKILKRSAQEAPDAAEWGRVSPAGLLSHLVPKCAPETCGIHGCSVSYMDKLRSFHTVYVHPTLGWAWWPTQCKCCVNSCYVVLFRK